MVIKNLQFFDNNGYNLNFDWNDEYGYWEGNIYLPKVSVGLYANTSIYVLEETDGRFHFPIVPIGPREITFTWDKLNKFVDEFFMFTFDETYTAKETSSLTYTPNDGPDCETLIINRFDEYSIELDQTETSKVLPIHIAFMANERYDATTYNRTLIMSYNGSTVARIKFFAETVEEDERLKIWNENLGYNITPEDTIIFKKSDIKEYKPDYVLLNEKRKELMMEGSNIYPYIGSYKAIINAIKFFGYENLNIIEFWRNVNKDDENFGKIYHSSKYSLNHKETIKIGTRNIVLPNKDYKKINSLALVYSMNKITGDVDELDLPKVKEEFAYTIEEAFVKLFALRKKLNKEFMPANSKIIDIIGEANYFGIKGIRKINERQNISIEGMEYNPSFDIYPNKYLHITDNTYFGRYINTKFNNTNINNSLLSDMINDPINENDSISEDIPNIYDIDELLNNLYPDSDSENIKDKCDWYRSYYNDVFVNHISYKDNENFDESPYTDTKPLKRFSAKCILTNTTFSDVTFEDCDLKFNCEISSAESAEDDDNKIVVDKIDLGDISFYDINESIKPDKVEWTISFSKNQYDEDLKNIGIIKNYSLDFTPNNIVLYGEEVFVELPYVGYYDVTMDLKYLKDNGNSDNENDYTSKKKTIRKYIKVEPYQINLIGFYYDANDLPKSIKYEMDDDIKTFIETNVNHMYDLALSERTNTSSTTNESSVLGTDAAMPYYEAPDNKLAAGSNPYINSKKDIKINKSPNPCYYRTEVNTAWCIADNVNDEIAKLEPITKYTRYIKNGVDVKPFTWFLLGYDYSKIVGKSESSWCITNVSTDEKIEFKNKRYLTLLLKKEGNYRVDLTLKDKLGNKYEISRNIIVVKKSANYNIYQTFKKDYDYYIEQKNLKQQTEHYLDDKE